MSTREVLLFAVKEEAEGGLEVEDWGRWRMDWMEGVEVVGCEDWEGVVGWRVDGLGRWGVEDEGMRCCGGGGCGDVVVGCLSGVDDEGVAGVPATVWRRVILGFRAGRVDFGISPDEGLLLTTDSGGGVPMVCQGEAGILLLSGAGVLGGEGAVGSNFS